MVKSSVGTAAAVPTIDRRQSSNTPRAPGNLKVIIRVLSQSLPRASEPRSRFVERDRRKPAAKRADPWNRAEMRSPWIDGSEVCCVMAEEGRRRCEDGFILRNFG